MYANRRLTRGQRGKQLQRLRSERVERSFAHVCETGGPRRTWLWGLDKVRKRYLIAAAAHNLGIVIRKLFGIRTPRGLQAFVDLAEALYLAIRALPWRLNIDRGRFVPQHLATPLLPAAG